ncbi:MAG: TolC family protein, partial [Nitrospira sp.]
MNSRYSTHRPFRAGIAFVMVWCLVCPLHSWGLDATQPIPAERREAVSLADAAVRALQKNLDIRVSRQNRESRLADIIIEQSKFDPNLSLNGQYNRTVNPLNRPIFGGTGGALNQITLFD